MDCDAARPERPPAAPAPKRRAVPPGYLWDYNRASKRLRSMIAGRGGGGGGSKRSLDPARAPSTRAPRGAGAGAERPGPERDRLSQQLQVLPAIFERRSRHLEMLRGAGGNPGPYSRRPGQPAGLLSLPEEVLLKIVCLLGHEEIRPLFGVCSQLRTALREAVQSHFNYNTPHRACSEGRARGPAHERSKRRSVTSLAAVLDQIGRRRGSHGQLAELAPAVPQPRVLSFSEVGKIRGADAGVQRGEGP